MIKKLLPALAATMLLGAGTPPGGAEPDPRALMLQARGMQRDGGGETAGEGAENSNDADASAAANGLEAGTPSANAAARKKTEEEEDVLLDS